MTGSEPRPFRDKTVVITGASSGIGAEAALQFAERGATVAVVGRSPDKTAAIARAVAGRAHLVDYGQLADPASKLATILFTRELAARTRGTGITAVAFHPGVVATGLGRHSPVFRLMNSRAGRVVLATPRKGAEPMLHLAAIADPQSLNGSYFNRLKPEDPVGAQARDPALARRLWERSAELTGLD